MFLHDYFVSIFKVYTFHSLTYVCIAKSVKCYDICEYLYMVCESSFYYNNIISYCISSEFIIMIINK